MIYSAGSKGPFKVQGYHDPDSVRKFNIVLRPPEWSAGTVYGRTGDDFDTVIPTTFKGLYYGVENPGISNATTEPTWAKTVGELTEDFESGQTEGLTWKAYQYTMMPAGVTISSSTFTATQDVTLSSTSNTTTTLLFTIDAIGSTADARTTKKFQVSIHATLSNGEEMDITLEFKIAEK